MNVLHIPREYWDWRCSVLVLVVTATPLLSLAWLATDRHDVLVSAAGLDGLVVVPAAVAATLCFYVAWRISARPSLAWWATGTAVVAIQGVTVAGLQLADPKLTDHQGFWMAMSDGALLVSILAITDAARRTTRLGEPVVLGIVTGLALGVARLAAVNGLPHVDLLAKGAWPVVLGCLVFAGPPVVLLWRLEPVPAWGRGRLASAVALFAMAHLSTYVDGASRSVVGSVVTLAGDLGGAVMLASAAIGMLRQAIVTERDDRDGLQLRLTALEAGAREDRARIHEINSTIAGVVSATRLLRENVGVGHERRALLDDMVHAELGRLQRLLNQPVVAPRPRTVDLDATIGNLVLAQEARGNRVTWLPSGARVSGEADDVAEVVNILLDNAAKHGSADASVTVESVADAVEIVISDGGPGVAPEVRSHLFEWGARGPRSAGQGIGLNIAHDLTVRHGGYLRLREDTTRGATFVVGFPAARRGDDEPAHIA